MTTPDFRDSASAVLARKPDLVRLQFSQEGRLSCTWRNWIYYQYYESLYSDKYLLCCASIVLRDVLSCSSESTTSEQHQTIQILNLEDPPNAWWEVLRIIHPLDHTVRHDCIAPAQPTDWTWDTLLPVALLADKYQMDCVLDAIRPAFTPGRMEPPPVGSHPEAVSVDQALENVRLLERLDCIDGVDMFLEVVADDMDNGRSSSWHQQFMQGLPHTLKQRLALQEWKVYSCDADGNYVWHRKGTKQWSPPHEWRLF